jgi:hypothetical protein
MLKIKNTLVSFKKLLRALTTEIESWGNFSRAVIACDWYNIFVFLQLIDLPNGSKFKIRMNHTGIKKRYIMLGWSSMLFFFSDEHGRREMLWF